MMDFERVTEVLQRYAVEIANEYKKNLTESGRNASRALYDSVQTRVETDNGSFLVVMTLLDYWRYIENGTRPHFPPISAIAKWIEVKPIAPRPMANGKLPTTRQLAYMIANKIAKYGTEGRDDLGRAKEDIFSKFRAELAQALGRDVVDYIRKVR